MRWPPCSDWRPTLGCTSAGSRRRVWRSPARATASRQLQQLERLGFVARRDDPSDGRVVSYATTAAGRGAQRRFRTVIRREVRGALAGWDADDRNLLARLLERMVGDFQAPAHP